MVEKKESGGQQTFCGRNFCYLILLASILGYKFPLRSSGLSQARLFRPPNLPLRQSSSSTTKKKRKVSEIPSPEMEGEREGGR